MYEDDGCRFVGLGSNEAHWSHYASVFPGSNHILSRVTQIMHGVNPNHYRLGWMLCLIHTVDILRNLFTKLLLSWNPLTSQENKAHDLQYVDCPDSDNPLTVDKDGRMWLNPATIPSVNMLLKTHIIYIVETLRNPLIQLLLSQNLSFVSEYICMTICIVLYFACQGNSYAPATDSKAMQNSPDLETRHL